MTYIKDLTKAGFKASKPIELMNGPQKGEIVEVKQHQKTIKFPTIEYTIKGDRAYQTYSSK